MYFFESSFLCGQIHLGFRGLFGWQMCLILSAVLIEGCQQFMKNNRVLGGGGWWDLFVVGEKS